MIKKGYREIRKFYWNIVRIKGFRDYFKENSIKKLHIGAGTNVLTGWLNTDLYPWRSGKKGKLYYLDLMKKLPYESNTFDFVFSEHVIEHFEFEECVDFFKEFHRTLKVDGVIRLITPDLKKLSELYSDNLTKKQKEYIKTVIKLYNNTKHQEFQCGFCVNMLFNFGHKFLFDFETLKLALEKSGFKNIVMYKPGETNIEVFKNIELHVKDYIAFESLVVEAQK